MSIDWESLLVGMVVNMETWVLLMFDLAAVLLIVKPSILFNFWTEQRAPATGLDRLIARFLGMIILWVQVTRWVRQTKDTNAGPIIYWLSIVSGVGAVVFLEYHLVVVLTSRLERRTQVEEAKQHDLLPESEEESRVRYRAAWRKYRMLRIAFPLVFLGWLPFGYIVGAVFRFLNWNEFIAGIIILAWIPLILIVGWPWSFWKCPRCGSAFKGIYDPFFPKHCRHCGLPKWGESPSA